MHSTGVNLLVAVIKFNWSCISPPVAPSDTLNNCTASWFSDGSVRSIASAVNNTDVLGFLGASDSNVNDIFWKSLTNRCTPVKSG